MDRKSVAGKIVEESIVLLKIEEKLLPFAEGKMIAFFGRTQIGTLYSGNGSGGAALLLTSMINAAIQRQYMITS